MGGGLTVESEAGVGSTFTFSIRARAARDVPTRSWDPGLAAGRRVLVVDDNATNRRVLCAQLQAWGFGSEPAEGAQAALEALSDGRPFAVAILDLHMPDVDGLELARRIRALRRDLPLVLLSSSQLEPGLEAGLFVAKLLKPARQSRLFDAVARALGAAAPESVTIQPVPGRRLSDLAPLRLLVVDDNEVNRTIAGLVLRRFGFRPDVAVNGREAVEKVLHHLSDAPDALPYDVVFMDVHMPELDGLAATRELGFQREARPDAPWPEVVAMTADAMQGDREACLAAGMDDYLTKPLDFEAVEVVLERAVVRRVSGAGARSQETARGPGPAAEGPSAAPAQAPDAPALVDWSRLDELREFDTPDGAIVRAAVDAFTAQAPGLLSALRSHAQRGDASAVRDTAHALKGSASNVGAVSLASLASSIERAGRSGDLAEAPDLVGGLDGVLEATLDELRRRG